MKENNISQLGDYDMPFCEQQYTHRSCYISQFKFKSFDQIIPPKLPEILDIYSVVADYRMTNLRLALSFILTIVSTVKKSSELLFILSLGSYSRRTETLFQKRNTEHQ